MSGCVCRLQACGGLANAVDGGRLNRDEVDPIRSVDERVRQAMIRHDILFSYVVLFSAE